MRPARLVPAEGFVEHDVLDSIVEVTDPADYMTDAHVVIIDDHAKVVGRKSVSLDDNEVLDLLSNLTSDDVRKAHETIWIALLIYAHPEAMRLTCFDAAPGFGGVQLGVGELPDDLRILGAVLSRSLGKVGIEESIREHLGGDVPIEVKSLALVVGPLGTVDPRPLVPVAAEPREDLADVAVSTFNVALLVRILDSKQELTTVLSSEGIVEQR